jgi:hypothetical protein
MVGLIDTIAKFLVEYLKNKPFTDVLIIILILCTVGMYVVHRMDAKEAHSMVHAVLKERDAREDERAKEQRDANEHNTDRIVSIMTGVKKEVTKTGAILTGDAKVVSPDKEKD